MRTFSFSQGDITKLQVFAIVNAANSSLLGTPFFHNCLGMLYSNSLQAVAVVRSLLSNTVVKNFVASDTHHQSTVPSTTQRDRNFWKNVRVPIIHVRSSFDAFHRQDVVRVYDG